MTYHTKTMPDYEVDRGSGISGIDMTQGAKIARRFCDTIHIRPRSRGDRRISEMRQSVTD